MVPLGAPTDLEPAFQRVWPPGWTRRCPTKGMSASPFPSLTTRDDHVVAYVLEPGRRSIYLIFRGDADRFGQHTDEFACMASSLQITRPTASPTATQ